MEKSNHGVPTSAESRLVHSLIGFGVILVFTLLWLVAFPEPKDENAIDLERFFEDLSGCVGESIVECKVIYSAEMRRRWNDIPDGEHLERAQRAGSRIWIDGEFDGMYVTVTIEGSIVRCYDWH